MKKTNKLEKCHELYSCRTETGRQTECNHCIIKYNDRPIQNLNNRIVTKSFWD